MRKEFNDVDMGADFERLMRMEEWKSVEEQFRRWHDKWNQEILHFVWPRSQR